MVATQRLPRPAGVAQRRHLRDRLRARLGGRFARTAAARAVGRGRLAMARRRRVAAARGRRVMAIAGASGAPGGGLADPAAGLAGGCAGACSRHPFLAVGAGAGVGGRYLRLLRGPGLGRPLVQAQAGADYQPGKELGGRGGRGDRRRRAGMGLGRGRIRMAAAFAQPVRAAFRSRPVAMASGAHVADRHERGGRSGGVAGQAGRRSQGQQPIAARSWRRARPA